MSGARAGRRWAGGVLAGVLLLGGGASGVRALAAQDSQFGVRGLGTPGRWESVRARSTGGAFGPFDPTSPLMEAALADIGHITATAMTGTSYRSAMVDSSTVALRTTRFPLMQLGGPLAGRFALGAGFTTYLDKTWDVTTRDSVALRGVMQPYTDHITSDGSVADLRLAGATRLSARLSLGAAVHLLAGSTKNTAQRTFADTIYHSALQTAEVRYQGFGLSGSALLSPTPTLTVAAWARADNTLRALVGTTTTAETDLPRMVGGGVRFAPSPGARFAAAAAWRSWSHAGPGAFNTWSWSAGAELGAGNSPLRFGARGGQLPFGPGATAPTEFAVAAGTGRAFSRGRGLLDLGLERLQRTGSGLSERVWTVLIGLTVRP